MRESLAPLCRRYGPRHDKGRPAWCRHAATTQRQLSTAAVTSAGTGTAHRGGQCSNDQTTGLTRGTGRGGKEMKCTKPSGRAIVKVGKCHPTLMQRRCQPAAKKKRRTAKKHTPKNSPQDKKNIKATMMGPIDITKDTQQACNPMVQLVLQCGYPRQCSPSVPRPHMRRAAPRGLVRRPHSKMSS